MPSDTFPALDPANTRTAMILGLRSCAAEIPRGAERHQLLRLAERLEQGASFDELIHQPDRRHAAIAEIIIAGTESGHLPQVLNEYLHCLRENRRLWRSFLWGLTYPIFIMFMASLICGMFIMLNVSQMKRLFLGFGIELPGMTVALIHIGDLLLWTWPWVLSIIILTFAVSLLLLQGILPIQPTAISLLRDVPIIGGSWRNAAAADFCMQLAVLVEAGIPLPRAMQILSITVHDRATRKKARRIGEHLANGAPASSIRNSVPGLMPRLAGVFRWADDPQIFADGLRSEAELFAAQARMRNSQLNFIIGPITCIGVGFAAGFIVIAFFTPLVKLLNDLS